ncbi:MAG: thioredoxin family protein [Flammeovirgaceae bacterium]
MKTLLVSAVLFLSFQLHSQGLEGVILPNAYNKETVSLGQYTMPVVVIFTSNECPFDNYYKTRIKDMVTTYLGKVQFVLINSNQDAQESLEKMAIHNGDLGIPYLADKDQLAMDILGARKSPEAFLLKNEGGKMMVQYSGAIDDSPQVASAAKQSYLKDAIDKLLSGTKIEVNNNRAVGCTIKKRSMRLRGLLHPKSRPTTLSPPRLWRARPFSQKT